MAERQDHHADRLQARRRLPVRGHCACDSPLLPSGTRKWLSFESYPCAATLLSMKWRCRTFGVPPRPAIAAGRLVSTGIHADNTINMIVIRPVAHADLEPLVELAGMAAGSQYDQLIHSGTATFGGTLDVDLLGGFVPVDGAEFVLATYAEHTGAFSSLDFPSLPTGLTWLLRYEPNSLVLTSTSRLAGDIDLDGDVDRTDAALFAPHLGFATGAVWATGDFDGDGATTLGDLALLQANLGLVEARSATAVPEPSTVIALWVIFSAIVILSRHRSARLEGGPIATDRQFTHLAR